MKKPKINGDVVKQFFITHGEKIGTAVAVALTGMVVYSAFGVTLYPKKPEDLTRDTTTAKKRIDDSKLDLDEAGIKLPTDKFTDTIDRELLKRLDPAKFATSEWNKPLFELKQRRREPKYLELTDLRCSYHFAPVSFKAADGAAGGGAGGGNQGGRPLGKEWITVVGLVPVEAQTAEYTKAFHNALDITTNASPTYRVYQIRRAEVKSLDPSEPVDWEKLQPVDLQVAINGPIGEWHGTGTETAHPDAVRAPLTEPLPPLPNGDYGPWSIHPEIPPVPPRADNAPAPAAVAPPPTNFINNGAPANGGQPAPAPAANAAAQQPPPKPAVKNLLFRFIDFDVKAGKQYRYQVKLVVSNPNFGLDAAHLEKPALAQGETRETKWSLPSLPVGIPFHDRYFGGGVKTLGSDAEPTTSAAVKNWMPEFGAMGLVEFSEYLRGGLLTNGAATIFYTAPGGQAVGKSAQAYNSGATLLDFAWEKTADRLRGPNDRPMAKPSEMLLINDRGELKICAQMMDADFWKEMKSLKAGTPIPVAPTTIGTGAPAGSGVPAPAGNTGVAPTTTTPVATGTPPPATSTGTPTITTPSTPTTTTTGTEPSKPTLKLK